MKKDLSFFESINYCIYNEKDIEFRFRKELEDKLKTKITSFGNTDGVIQTEDLHTIIEIKYNFNFSRRDKQCIAILQALYYIRQKFFDLKKEIPSSIFCSDQKNGFVLSVDCLNNYIKNDKIDWSCSPSSAYIENKELLEVIINDNNISPVMIPINEMFSINKVITKLKNCHKNISEQYDITNDTIIEAFNYWQDYVIKNKSYDEKDIELFYYSLIGDFQKINEDMVIISNEEVFVNCNQYNRFFSLYRNKINKEELLSCKDRLIEEIKRRMEGSYYTPPIWVEEAHIEICNKVGNNWYDEYVVWDCSCGTGNLTRGYKFKNLFLSTLHQEDLNIIFQSGYNPEAILFQFDFLNDPISKLPKELLWHIENGSKIILLNNPPYGQAASINNRKSGISNTKVKDEMNRDKMGFSSTELYCQFMYRMCKLTRNSKECILCTFTKPKFLSRPYFKEFRDFLFNRFSFSFLYGMIFKASQFSDINSSWPVSFTIVKREKKIIEDLRDLSLDNKMEFEISIKEEKERKIIETSKEKIIASTIDFLDIVREKAKTGKKDKIIPHLKGPVKPTGKHTTLYCDSIGYMNKFSGMQKSEIYTAVSYERGSPINIKNFESAIAYFVTDFHRVDMFNRGNIIYESINIFPTDNINKLSYKEWISDCIVFSCFSSSSNQSSIRNIKINKHFYQVINEFFFISIDEMKNLAENFRFSDMLNDIQKYGNNRFVYNYLQSSSISNESKDILNASFDLVQKSFELRKSLNRKNPEYRLFCWDAGWVQISFVLENGFKEDNNKFKILINNLYNKICNGVYEFGYLRIK